MDLVKGLNLPRVEVITRGKERPNLAPIVLSTDSLHQLDSYVKLLRLAYKRNNETLTVLTQELGVKLKEGEPLIVFPYTIGFGKLRQMLPMGLGRSTLGDTKLKDIGWIPVSTADEETTELDGWRFRYSNRSYEEIPGCGHTKEIVNFMQRNEGGNSMKFWLSPYAEEGLELVSNKWYGDFSFSVNCLDYRDSASVLVELSGSDQTVFPTNLKFEFERKFYDPVRVLKFSHGKPESYGKPPKRTYGNLAPVIPPGEKIKRGTLERVVKSGIDNATVDYEDLVTADTFPNLDTQVHDLKSIQTLAKMLTAFEEADFNALQGFNWVVFR